MQVQVREVCDFYQGRVVEDCILPGWLVEDTERFFELDDPRGVVRGLVHAVRREAPQEEVGDEERDEHRHVECVVRRAASQARQRGPHTAQITSMQHRHRRRTPDRGR